MLSGPQEEKLMVHRSHFQAMLQEGLGKIMEDKSILPHSCELLCRPADKRKSDRSQNIASVQPVTVPAGTFDSRGLKKLYWESGLPLSAHSKHQEVWSENAPCQRGCPTPGGKGTGCVHCWIQEWPEVFPSASWLLTHPYWAMCVGLFSAHEFEQKVKWDKIDYLLLALQPEDGVKSLLVSIDCNGDIDKTVFTGFQ